MINLLKNKRIIFLVVILICLFTVGALAADPGSSDDPLISLSYFENKIESLKKTLLEDLTSTFGLEFNNLADDFTNKFDAATETFSNELNESKKQLDDTLEEIRENGVSTPTEFKVITLNEGEMILCEAGTEIIVRSGKSIVVTDKNSSGGISDITAGKDLANNEAIVNNHLLIVPKADGRGIKANVTGAVMVKGNFEKIIYGI